MSEEAPLGVDRDQQARALAKKLFTSIRQREQACRVQVAELYRHYRLALRAGLTAARYRPVRSG